jgi:hypothetical protein
MNTFTSDLAQIISSIGDIRTPAKGAIRFLKHLGESEHSGSDYCPRHGSRAAETSHFLPVFTRPDPWDYLQVDEQEGMGGCKRADLMQECVTQPEPISLRDIADKLSIEI